MQLILIATTRQSELEPLGTGGQTAISIAPALRAALLRSLSADHAALLAEPNPNPRRGEIDWYAESDGTVVRLADLPAALRAEAENRLARLGKDIFELTDRLVTSRSESDRFLGEMLRLAMVVPDESHIRMTARRPVLIGWGHRGAGPRYPNPLIIGTRPGSASQMRILPPPPAILGVVRQRAPQALWWAALAAAALLWLLPSWMLRRALAAPVPCLVAPAEIALFGRLNAMLTTGAALSARLTVLRTEAATPCPAAPRAPGTEPSAAPTSAPQ